MQNTHQGLLRTLLHDLLGQQPHLLPEGYPKSLKGCFQTFTLSLEAGDRVAFNTIFIPATIKELIVAASPPKPDFATSASKPELHWLRAP